MSDIPRVDVRHSLDRYRRSVPIPSSPFIEDPREQEVVVARRQQLSFDGRASGTMQRVTLASAIDVTGWVRGTLVTALHAKNAWLTAGGGNTTGQALFVAENIALDPDQPDIEYVETSRTVASLSVGAATVAPLLLQGLLVPPFGPSLRISVRFTQGAAAAAAAQTLAVSVYLVGRPR